MNSDQLWDVRYGTGSKDPGDSYSLVHSCLRKKENDILISQTDRCRHSKEICKPRSETQTRTHEPLLAASPGPGRFAQEDQKNMIERVP